MITNIGVTGRIVDRWVSAESTEDAGELNFGVPKIHR
jgi:hypothetical protein